VLSVAPAAEVVAAAVAVAEAPSEPTFGGEVSPAPALVAESALPLEEEVPEDPKEAKRKAKEAKKAARLAEKERKKAEKLAAKEAKIRAKEAALLGHGTEGVAMARGGERLAPKLIKWLVVLAIIGGGVGAWMGGYLDPVLNSPMVKAGIQTVSETAQPYVIQAIEKVPALGNFLSPIAGLEDVAPEDYEELKTAALGDGTAVAVALSRADPLAPAFYVSSNRPDGTALEVQVDGVAGTLLNQISFTARVSAPMAKRLGKTAVVQGNDGKPVARGEYTIAVYEPKGDKPLAKKTYFLGGAKDATYATRLKAFHEQYQKIAKDELTEVGQLLATLELQLNESIANFGKLSKGKVTKVQQKAWNAAHTKWMTLDGQLNQKFSKLTPEALQKDYFYGVLYDLVVKAAQAVEKLHGLHHAHFTGTGDPKALEIQRGEALAGAQAALQALKTKLEAAEKLPPTPSGMPRRDGL
jgi:hypothetical protein